MYIMIWITFVFKTTNKQQEEQQKLANGSNSRTKSKLFLIYKLVIIHENGEINRKGSVQFL